MTGTSTPSSSTSASSGAKMKGYGTKAWNWSYKVSDKVAVYANAASHKMGGNAFYPAANDTPAEIQKCIKILKEFTEEGVEVKEVKDIKDAETGKQIKKQRKAFKKIPSAAIRQAKGLAIYTAFRTGIAPLSGAGGCGMVVARLPDGSWSAPASIMPNNVSGGLMIGLDIYDVVLVIRTQKALESFFSHKVSVGAELGLAAGPYGAGAIIESGKEMTPCWSYVKSRGLYAGVEAAAALLISRIDEMARFYHKPGVTAKDVLTGKVHFPYEARPLVEALKKAEQLPFQTEEAIDLDSLELDEDETLHLPPTPSQMAMDESVGFKEAWESQDRPDHDDDESERVFLRQMGPPPKHKSRQSRDLKSSAAGPSDSSEQHEQADVKSEIPAALPTEEEQTRIPTPPTVGSRAGTPDPSGPPPPLPRRRRPVPPPPASQQGSRAATPDFSRDSTDSARPPPTYPQQEKTEVPGEKQVTEDESLR